MPASPNPLHEPHDLNSDLGAIRRDLNALREDLSHITRGLTNGLADQVTDRGGRAARAVSHQIEEQPVISLIIAAAVGFLGGRLLLR
jgi:ElaB/YqjD/DUF883 family membrane-anchored ribosome-binding protein